MRPMQERAYAKRGEPYLLIKSPPAAGKSRALMCVVDPLDDDPAKRDRVSAALTDPARAPPPAAAVRAVLSLS